jgi:hypothetical protein
VVRIESDGGAMVLQGQVPIARMQRECGEGGMAAGPAERRADLPVALGFGNLALSGELTAQPVVELAARRRVRGQKSSIGVGRKVGSDESRGQSVPQPLLAGQFRGSLQIVGTAEMSDGLQDVPRRQVRTAGVDHLASQVELQGTTDPLVGGLQKAGRVEQAKPLPRALVHAKRSAQVLCRPRRRRREELLGLHPKRLDVVWKEARHAFPADCSRKQPHGRGSQEQQQKAGEQGAVRETAEPSSRHGH